MKKLITFLSACVLTCMVFSSCSSNFEITKRRYNKGYYINHSGNKEMALITKEKASEVKITAQTYPVQKITEQNTQALTSIPQYKKKSVVFVTGAEKAEHKAVLATNTVVMIKNLPAAVEVPVLQTSSSVSAVNNITDNDDHARRDALSLFWLIILIVLIVWAIGLVAGGWGLGGFINILLVIALILLILWLLRIV